MSDAVAVVLLIGRVVFAIPFFVSAMAHLQQQQQVVFMRNVTFVGAAIALLAAFVAFGDEVPYAITGALFEF